MSTTMCEWPTPDITCPAFESLILEDRQQIIEAATGLLWNWTGQQYGLCTITVRPCREGCGGDGALSNGHWTAGKMMPTLIGGQWTNLGCGTCTGDLCGCRALSSLKLPGPVDSIIEVQIDGVVVPNTEYRVDNSKYLVREGDGSWPVCQDLSVPDGEVGSWSVTYRRGVPVPAGGQLAAAKLICELAKAQTADATCQLPKRIQQITRQGITVALIDDMKDIEKGRTGIWSIDSWVASVQSIKPRSTVFSPDRPRANPRRTTWRAP